MNLAVLGKATVTNGSGDIRTAACRPSDQQRPRLAQRGIEPRRTPQTTIEAIIHSVSERGLAALKDVANVTKPRDRKSTTA